MAASLPVGESIWTNLLNEFFSPINLALTLICAYLAYRILRNNKEDDSSFNPVQPLPPLPKHDMTLEELATFDGNNSDGRVCLAINRKVFDVTKGKNYYSKGGPYAQFAGKDVTRALGSFDITAIKDTWDDYEGISNAHMASAKEWEEQFNERYDFVGYLVKDKKEDTADEDREESFEKIEK